jgi:hypothetical protein
MCMSDMFSKIAHQMGCRLRLIVITRGYCTNGLILQCGLETGVTCKAGGLLRDKGSVQGSYSRSSCPGRCVLIELLAQITIPIVLHSDCGHRHQLQMVLHRSYQP